MLVGADQRQKGVMRCTLTQVLGDVQFLSAKVMLPSTVKGPYSPALWRG